MLRCIYGECAHEQHVRRTLTLILTHTIIAYSVSGNVAHLCILICATRQKPCRKRVYPASDRSIEKTVEVPRTMKTTFLEKSTIVYVNIKSEHAHWVILHNNVY